MIRTVKDESLSALADSIRRKTGTASPLTFPEGFLEAVEGLHGKPAFCREQEINFWDYDGTLLYSCGLQELTELPPAPIHDGLVFQGWNWSLESIRQYGGPVDVGAIYAPADGLTHVFVTVGQQTRQVTLYLQPAGALAVDWGAGSGFRAAYAENGVCILPHTYDAPGRYEIRLAGDVTLGLNDGTHTFLGPNAENNQHMLSVADELWLGRATLGQYALARWTGLRRIVISEQAAVGNNTAELQYCRNLCHVNLPRSAVKLGNMQFQYCRSLSQVCTGENMGNANANSFGYCEALRRTAAAPKSTTVGYGTYYATPSLRETRIDSGVKTVGGSAFYAARAATELVIPESVTTLAAGAFNVMTGLRLVRFLPAQPPVAAATNVFGGWPADCVVQVPAGTLQAYQNATNYGGIAAQMMEV